MGYLKGYSCPLKSYWANFIQATPHPQLMVLQALRDSFLGQGLRLVAQPAWAQYREELDYPEIYITYVSKFEGQGSQVRTVDWYGLQDPENPQNWSPTKKAWVVFVIGFYSFVVYMAAPVYSLAEDAFQDEFQVNSAEASLGLALYVYVLPLRFGAGTIKLNGYSLGYGVGALLFSPLSEVPPIGRNVPYVVSFAIYIILSIPTAFAPDAVGFYLLRFLQGFFGSPCLATGGASISDVYHPDILPYPMTAWVYCIFCAPAVGTLIAGFVIPVLGWRFAMWEILMAAGPALICLLSLPETSAPTILHHRARRLQARDPSHLYLASTEIPPSWGTIIRESLLTPSRITLLDPILFVNIYTSLVYGIYYSFFEAFPLVYGPIYHFNLGETGTAFLALAIGTTISVIIYTLCNYTVLLPRAKSRARQEPEEHLTPALVACFGPPVALLLFGWSSRPGIHWIIPTLGIILYPACVFVLMQSVFLYIPACYPRHAASVFAASDFLRSAFACGAILFSRPMFINLGVGRGCSLLAGLTVACILGIYALRFYGERLRVRRRW